MLESTHNLVKRVVNIENNKYNGRYIQGDTKCPETCNVLQGLYAFYTRLEAVSHKHSVY